MQISRPFLRSKALAAAVGLAVMSMMVVVPAGGAASAKAPASEQQICMAFPETGKAVCGLFLQYWKDHGGLAQQGYPISGEFMEQSSIDGKTYMVQYFERAVFEVHPVNKSPNNVVMLSLLGTMTMKEKYPAGPPASPTAMNPQQGQLFPETGKYVYSEFLDYWKANGGLAQQGFPISDRFSEKSDIDGKLYTVQYFERAVFELHPENKPPFNVLLTQLGTMRFKKLYPNGAPGAPPSGTGTALKTGQWGGEHVSMDVRADGAYLEFDCAHAALTQPMAVDPNGKLDMRGTFTLEHGGPVFENEQENPGRPARFTGTLAGDKLLLTITYADDNTPAGNWTLVFGQQPRLFKCL